MASKLQDKNTKNPSGNYKSLDEKSTRGAQRKETRRIGDFFTDLLDCWTSEDPVEEETFTNEELFENDDLFKSDRDDKNLIHRIIAGFSKKEKTDISTKKKPLPPQVLEVIQFLVLRDPKLFTTGDDRGDTPMGEAAKRQMSILSEVIGLLLPTPLHDNSKLYISCENDQGQCPLYQVSKALRKYCEIESDSTTNGDFHQDPFNHCLHKTIDIDKLVSYDNKLHQCLREALSSQKESLACLDAILHNSNFDRDYQDDYEERVRTFKIFLELCPDSVFGYAPYGKFTPLQTALRLYSKPTVSYKMVYEFVHLLVNRAPWSIFVESGHSLDSRNPPRNAYHILKEINIDNTSNEDHPLTPAEELLKRTCIGYDGKMWDTKEEKLIHHITSEEKIRYLYSDIKSENQFCFNLDGESEVISKTYIETIKKNSGLKFETTLEFVKLPYWKSHQRSASGEHSVLDGHILELDPYIHLFEWLWKSGTKKIFRIDVDDAGLDAHTNAGIREALRGDASESSMTRDFDIESWEWKKFDICTETISIAAPKARHVSLWSSGNTAILRGWASNSGLAKLQHLEKLTIEICPKNGKDASDCKQYEEELIQNLRLHCPKLEMKNIIVKFHQNSHSFQGGPNKGVGGDGPDTMNQINEETPSSVEWLAMLKDFQEFINLMNGHTKQSVKVAILDDGFRLTKSRNGKYRAQSFCYGKEAYFAGQCEHGTEMATCVWDVCPWAELHIGRLDDTHAVEDQNFTIQSCCKALRWALAMEVDVISMSWTFPAKDDNEDHYKAEFNSLIKDALEKNVLLFGSLPDKGPTIRTADLVPIGLAGVIRIGSATVHGTGTPENVYGGADFLFPGEGKNEGGKIVSGSSYATAFASGLAATVLLALRMHENLTKDEKAQQCLLQARTTEGMKKIFKRLSQQKPDAVNPKGFYVRPYHTFGSEFGIGEVGRKITLSNIVDKIVARDLDHK